MKYYNIKKKLELLKIFSPNDILIIDPTFRVETLYEWEKDGLVTKLRSKKYIFSDFIPYDKDFYFIANKLYSPSYISLELALNHYGIIPEAVQAITSVTTNKTLSVDNTIGSFNYKSIGKKLFWGYNLVEEQNITYKIASLEKTFIDYFYLNNINSIKDIDALRFNTNEIKESLNTDLLLEYTKIVNSKILTERVSLLLNYIK